MKGIHLQRGTGPSGRVLRYNPVAKFEPNVPPPRPDKKPIKRYIQKGIPIPSSSSGPGDSKWTTGYEQQQANLPIEENVPFVLPVMMLPKTKIPTDTVQLQIFEPRYRLMFKLVAKSRSKRFGVVLADPGKGIMESVGCLCELTHFIPVPSRQRIFISARAIGRFQTKKIINDKPFVTIEGVNYRDERIPGLDNEAQLAAIEGRLWQNMLEVRELARKLFTKDSQSLGDEVFALETRRYCPDPEVRSGVKLAPGSDPELLVAIERAGLLGEDPEQARANGIEHFCSDALRQIDERERREMWSFALARALELDQEELAGCLVGRSTASRLLELESKVLEGRNYLAARSTLRDMF